MVGGREVRAWAAWARENLDEDFRTGSWKGITWPRRVWSQGERGWGLSASQGLCMEPLSLLPLSGVPTFLRGGGLRSSVPRVSAPYRRETKGVPVLGPLTAPGTKYDKRREPTKQLTPCAPFCESQNPFFCRRLPENLKAPNKMGWKSPKGEQAPSGDSREMPHLTHRRLCRLRLFSCQCVQVLLTELPIKVSLT